MKAKRIKDAKTGKEIVIAKDGREMAESSLANINPANGFQKHPENINRTGLQAKNKIFREQLIDVLNEPVSKKDKRTKLIAVCEKIVDTMLNAQTEHTVKQLGELLLGHIDGKILDQQQNTNATFPNAVIFLPNKRDDTIE